jgi:hypothetical protein
MDGFTSSRQSHGRDFGHASDFPLISFENELPPELQMSETSLRKRA